MATATITGYVAAYYLSSTYDTLSVTSTGTIGNDVIGEDGNNTTVLNSGRIGSTDASIGVLISRGGTVIDDLGAGITAGGAGVMFGTSYGAPFVYSFASLVNNGTILGGTGAGAYFGSNNHLGVFVTNGNAGNTAALISGSYGIYDRPGPKATSDTTIDNFGIIRGTGGTGFAGISFVLNTRGTVVNGSPLDQAALITGYIGVDGTRGQPITVQNFATIQGTGGTAVALPQLSMVIDEAGAVFDGIVSGAYGTLRLAGDAGPGTLTGLGVQFTNFSTVEVDSGASWVLTGSNTIATGQTLISYGTLTNAGLILATATRYALILGGSVTNQAGGNLVNGTGGSAAGLITGAQYGVLLTPQYGHTVTNRGTISGGYGIQTYGYGLNTSAGQTVIDSGTIIGTAGTAIRLGYGNDLLQFQGNSAFIEGIVDGVGGNDTLEFVSAATAGTLTGSAAYFVNFGTAIIDPGAVWWFAGSNTLGVNTTLTDAGTLVNSGSLVVDPPLLVSGIFVNTGSIDAPGPDPAVSILSGGEVGNTGVINSSVDAITGSGIVVNAGTIRSTIGAGVALTSGTITNYGTISGAGTAISFSGTANNLVVLKHGYALQGGIAGSASASNTLQLLGSSASASVVANYNALGLTNFGTVAFAPGAGNYATLTITSTVALPHTVAGFTGLHDIIDLTTLSDVGNDAATSFDTLTNVLTVTGDNGSVQLQLDNEDYTGIHWYTSNDGSGGTEVTLLPPAPSITGARANQAVADETPGTPFAGVTEVDPNLGATPTVTVTLSVPGNETLSNLSGGSYDPATGVYQVTGSAAADTAALAALVFTPIMPANVDVSTTTFTISPGAGGTADSTTSVTAVRQILSLADLPANQIVISVSPDGTGFAAAAAGKTNEAVVLAPVAGGSYTVPTGYQALFLGGTSDATLNDASVGNAILVANSGNDQLFANAANDVLVAGSGNDSLFAGSFASTVVGGAGAATVFGGSGPMRVIDGTGPLTFVGGAGSVTITGSSGAETLTAGPGGLLYAGAASGRATINSGTGSVTLFGAAGGALNLTGSSGNPDYLVAGDGNETLNASGSSSSNWLSVNTAVSSAASVAMIGGSGSDTLIGGSAPGSTIMTGGDGADAFVFFKQLAGGARDIITDFNANDAVFIEGYGPGSAGALQNSAIVGAGGLTLTLSDNTTITFSNLTNAQSLDGKIQYG